jgi:hypothetical protein
MSVLAQVEEAIVSQLGIKKLRRDDEEQTIQFTVGVNHTDVRVHCRLLTEPQMLAISCYFDIKVPDAARAEVLEYAMRRSLRFKYGNDMVSDNIYIHYTYHFIQGEVLDPALVAVLVDAGIRTTDEAFPHVMAILFGGKTAEQIFSEEDEKRRKESN